MRETEYELESDNGYERVCKRDSEKGRKKEIGKERGTEKETERG